jgi:hypothetical protein
LEDLFASGPWQTLVDEATVLVDGVVVQHLTWFAGFHHVGHIHIFVADVAIVL